MLYIFYIFIAVAFIQICYFLLFGAYAFAKQKKQTSLDVPVSIIVCAKNETENLRTLIPKLLQQNYPLFEIVLINDASTDETLAVMEGFAQKHTHVKIVNVENNEAFWGNKKYALTLGIKAAANDYLLFTDADCVPASENWLREMSSCFSKEKKIILGYGAYEKKKGSFINLLIRFETLMAAIQAFSYAKLGIPYTAVGRNLAYHRSEFYRVNGFVNHMKVLSGDDDLFIKDAATSENTIICDAPDGFTISNTKNTFSEWFLQKRRHVITSEYYKSIHKTLLALFFTTQYLFWMLGILLLSLVVQWQIVALVMLLRIGVQYLIIGLSAKKLQEKDTLPFLPILELFLIIVHFGIFIANVISKPTHWK